MRAGEMYFAAGTRKNNFWKNFGIGRVSTIIHIL